MKATLRLPQRATYADYLAAEGVFALDAQTGRVRWHVDPDTFPSSAFPLARDGVVYLSSGPKRGKAIRGKP